jgi:hypothetical protein
VREQALADDQVRRRGLVRRLGHHGGGVVHTHARREVAVALESPRYIMNGRFMISAFLGGWRKMLSCTDRMNSSWVGLCPSPSPPTRSFSENNAENVLSKAIRSCAYFRRSDSY